MQFVPIDAASSGTSVDYAHLASLADTLMLPTLPQGTDSYDFLDLLPVLEADTTFDTADYWPGSLDGCRVDGRLIGLPATVQPLLVMYDGAAFDAAGLARLSPGWSWQDFEQAARRLSGTQVGIRHFGFVDGGWPMGLLGPLAAATLSQPGKNNANDLSQALDWYVSLAQDGGIPVPAQEGASSTSQDWIDTGQTAMWVDRLSSLEQRRHDIDPAVGIAPFPEGAGETGNQATPASVECVLVSAGTIHPKEAWSWLQFLTAHPLSQADPTRIIPARVDTTLASNTWLGLDQPAQVALRYALEHAWYGSNSNPLFTDINRALLQAMAGESPLVQALQALAFNEKKTPVTEQASPTSAPIVVISPEPTAEATLPSGAILVNYYVDSDISQAGLDVLQPLADEFHKDHPDIWIHLADLHSSKLPYINFDMLTENFDCFSYPSMGFNLSSPSLASLEPLLAKDDDARSLLTDIPPSHWALNRVNGELYGLPVSTRPLVMYYNKTLLASLGLEPPAPGWSLDDFWALANAVAAKAPANTAASAEIYGFVPLDGRGFVNYLLTSQGVQLYDFSATPPNINFNQPDVLNIVSKLADEAAQGAIPAIDDPPDYRKGNAGERLNLVQQGQAALWMDQAGGDSSLFPPDQSPDFEIGVVPLPATGRPLEPDQSGVSLFISKKAQNPEACWEWMKFLSVHPEAFLGIPVRSSALDSPEFKAHAGADTAAVYQQVLTQPHQDPYPDLVEKYPSSPLYIWWPDTLASVFEGASPAQALTELQGKAQAYLKCISAASDPNQQDAWVGCAKQADPEFKLPYAD